MKLLKWLNSWVFYWGSEDERVKQGADRAGHVGFMIAVAELLVLLLVLSFGLAIQPKHMVLMIAGMTLLPLAVYIGIWLVRGLSFLETRSQKRGFVWLIASCPLVFAGLAWGLESNYRFFVGYEWLWIGGMALGGTALCALSIYVLNRLSRAKAKKAMGPD